MPPQPKAEDRISRGREAELAYMRQAAGAGFNVIDRNAGGEGAPLIFVPGYGQLALPDAELSARFYHPADGGLVAHRSQHEVKSRRPTGRGEISIPLSNVQAYAILAEVTGADSPTTPNSILVAIEPEGDDDSFLIAPADRLHEAVTGFGLVCRNNYGRNATGELAEAPYFDLGSDIWQRFPKWVLDKLGVSVDELAKLTRQHNRAASAAALGRLDAATKAASQRPAMTPRR